MPVRLDVAAVQRGLFTSRARARAAIDAGLVHVNGAPAKASLPVGENDLVELVGEPLRYVSRGGLKLEKALAAFGLDPTGLTCLDAGASTGGFADCLLQAGAAHVVAVDVGHGQLAASLTADPRVTNVEGCDIRALDAAAVGGPFGLVATDVSFISLGKVLGALAAAAAEGAPVVCLIKPQFEAGPEHVGKRGVVKDPAVHAQVIARVLDQARAAGLEPAALDYSPITGPEGNIEYLLLSYKTAVDTTEKPSPQGALLDIEGVVAAGRRAHGR